MNHYTIYFNLAALFQLSKGLKMECEREVCIPVCFSGFDRLMY